MCAPREVCPIRLWFKSSAWYLLAYCMQKRALRTFKLTRIKRLRAIPGEFPDEALACAQIEPTDIQPDTPPGPLHVAHRRKHGVPRLRRL